MVKIDPGVDHPGCLTGAIPKSNALYIPCHESRLRDRKASAECNDPIGFDRLDVAILLQTSYLIRRKMRNKTTRLSLECRFNSGRIYLVSLKNALAHLG